MNRSRRLRLFCKGEKKGTVARRYLRITPPFLSYLLRVDIDKLIARIDALPVEQKERR
jgi:hypothetical protein